MRDRAKILVGNREVAKRYLGSRLVWELSSALFRYEGIVYFNEVSTYSKTGKGFEIRKEFDNKFENQIKSVAISNGSQTIKIPIIENAFTTYSSLFLVNNSDYDMLRSKFGSRANLVLNFYS